MSRLLLFLAALCAFPWAHAQVNELGGTIGATYYIGDLNPTKHYPPGTKLAGGLVFRHNFNDRYAVRLQGLYGTLQAYDSNSEDTLQLIRNLHFRSSLIECAALLEVNFFKYRFKGKGGRKWTPFVFAGLAYFRTNPQAEYDGEWYDLQPLGTEGQGSTARDGSEPYKLDQICIPFGTGLKFNVGRIDFQVEWGLRRTYTDYIDDVSGTYVDNLQLAFENGPLAAALADRSGLEQVGFDNTDHARGDVNTRDWYQYTGFTITYIISRFSDCEEQYNWMRRKN